MKNIIASLFAYTLPLLLIGCSTTSKIEALKPEPSVNTKIAYNNTTSFVSMPLEISLNEIENQLNKSFSNIPPFSSSS